MRRTKRMPELDFNIDEKSSSVLEHIGVEPMLLALSMELALKAWCVFDFDTPKTKRTHDLIKLFDTLTAESQERLDTEFRRSVAPRYPSGIGFDNGIRNVLSQHKDAFVDWRYLHEMKKYRSFQVSAFEATLELVLAEFEKNYEVKRVQNRGRLGLT